jgi:transmembrane sensor
VHNGSRPFIVHVNDITVTDLGTSFNILGTSGRTEIVVETGTVKVSSRGKSLTLHPGGWAVAWEGGKLKKEISKDKLYSYYLGRPLVCDSVPLKRLVEILNEDYDTHIIIGKKELESLPITTTFPHKESLNNILAVICATFDISAARENQTIVLK